LVGKPVGKRPLGRPRHRLEDNIKMDLQEVGCRDMAWISSVPRNFFRGGGGVQQIQFRTKRTGIWGQWSPSQGFWRQL
jgi:hypothetical protein